MNSVSSRTLLLMCVLVSAACRPTQSTDDAVSHAGDNAAPIAGDTTPSPGAPPVAPVIMTGDRLTDASGRSVYTLVGNMDGSKCDATCEDAWPPVLVEAAVGNVDGIQQGTLANRTRADGTIQVTYEGQPLYRYAGDGSADSTSGHGVNDQWGEWKLASGTPAAR